MFVVPLLGVNQNIIMRMRYLLCNTALVTYNCMNSIKLIMPPKKRRKLNKRELFNQLKEKGKRGSVARGKGVGSQQEFVLPANWKEELVEDSSGHQKLNYRSPGKSLYRPQKSVKEEFLNRNLKYCLNNPPYTESTDSDFDIENKTKVQNSSVVSVDVEPRLFVCQSSQIVDFVEQINITSKCAIPNCEGKRKIF